MRVPVCCRVLASYWGVGDVSRAVLFAASSRSDVAIVGGCRLPVRESGHTLSVAPSLP
jgi:hypothetical protein